MGDKKFNLFQTKSKLFFAVMGWWWLASPQRDFTILNTSDVKTVKIIKEINVKRLLPLWFSILVF